MAAAIAELPDERLWPRLEDRLPHHPPDYSVLHPLLLLRPPRCAVTTLAAVAVVDAAAAAAAAILVVHVDEDLPQDEEGLGLRGRLPLQLVVGDHQHWFPLCKRIRVMIFDEVSDVWGAAVGTVPNDMLWRWRQQCTRVGFTGESSTWKAAKHSCITGIVQATTNQSSPLLQDREQPKHQPSFRNAHHPRSKLFCSRGTGSYTT